MSETGNVIVAGTFSRPTNLPAHLQLGQRFRDDGDKGVYTIAGFSSSDLTRDAILVRDSDGDLMWMPFAPITRQSLLNAKQRIGRKLSDAG